MTTRLADLDPVDQCWIVDHYWIVEYVARRYRGRGEPAEDIEQVAAMGVVAAAGRYDPDTGGSFASFAIPTAMGEVRRHFRDRTWRVRVPRGIKDLAVQMGAATEELTGDLGRAPTAAEVADRLGVGVEQVQQAMLATRANSPVDTDAGRDPGHAADIDTEMLVAELIATLPERQRAIVWLRFFEDLSQEDIADRLGISQPHVSRLLRASLEQLRGRLADEPS
jgi:RNA polymerase sigma-B factor